MSELINDVQPRYFCVKVQKQDSLTGRVGREKLQNGCCRNFFPIYSVLCVCFPAPYDRVKVTKMCVYSNLRFSVREAQVMRTENLDLESPSIKNSYLNASKT